MDLGRVADLSESSEQTVADRRPVALDQQKAGWLDRMDALQHQAMAAVWKARRTGRVRAPHTALPRIESEEVGWCDVCGDFIVLPPKFDSSQRDLWVLRDTGGEISMG